MAVRDQLPLKQGLRLICCKLTNNRSYVRDQLPLKQGLRLIILVCFSL